MSYSPHNKTSEKQLSARENLYRLFRERPLPDEELLVNMGLFMRSSALAKILFLNELYQKINAIPGVMMVFGTWWGQDLTVLQNLRAVYEPYNYTRKILGFDTFKGYPSLSTKDKASDTIKEGSYHVSDDYLPYLEQILAYHDSENALPNVKKYELVSGDVSKSLTTYLDLHPETIISMAYLDLALYEPTKACLEQLKPFLIKGSVIAIDQLNAPEYPGETLALREVYGLGKYRIEASRILPDRSFLIFE